MKIIKLNLKFCCAFLVILIIEAIIAIFIRDDFIRPYLGDVLVVVLLYCFIKAFIRREIKFLPLNIFIFALLVEISQFFQIVSLLGLEDNQLIGILAGSVFDIKDIVCYLIGCISLMLFEKLAYRRQHKNF